MKKPRVSLIGRSGSSFSSAMVCPVTRTTCCKGDSSRRQCCHRCRRRSSAAYTSTSLWRTGVRSYRAEDCLRPPIAPCFQLVRTPARPRSTLSVCHRRQRINSSIMWLMLCCIFNNHTSEPVIAMRCEIE